LERQAGRDKTQKKNKEKEKKNAHAADPNDSVFVNSVINQDVV
jgi:hypothetical protein